MKYFWYLLWVCTFITFSKTTSAQKSGLINSGELMHQGMKLYDSAEYKKALALFDQISRSDTNYVWSLYGKAIACEADSQYSQTVKYCQEALALNEQREYEPDIYNTYGNTLNDMGEHEKALKVFDSAIAKYPAYAVYYYNKGIVMNALKRYSEAEQLFKQALLIDPYRYSAHFQLGVTALQQGKIIPAYLSFAGYLLLNPEGKYWKNCINLLNQISRSTDEVLDFKNKRTITQDDNYQAVEDIVLSKIALDQAYKPIISLDDPISRQIQAVFEKLDYKDSNQDFWIQYYLPFYKKVYANGQFEMFINHIFMSADVKSIQEYNKKHKKEHEQFKTGAADYFNRIEITRELNYEKRDSVTETYVFDDNTLLGKGTLANKGKILVGHWEGTYGMGNRKSKGDYNTAGNREGYWEFYYFTGQIQAKETYHDGKREGLATFYFENGNVSSSENYANGQLEGVSKTYYYAGTLKSIINYKAGKKDGEERDFYSNGNLESIDHFSNDQRSGEQRTYFKSGKIKEIAQYINGKAEGPFKAYYETGGTSYEGVYAKDKAEGEWKYYHENGKLKEKRNYVDDNEEGLHEEYDKNGQLSYRCNMKKGKIDGEANYYFNNGNVLANYVYGNGVVRSAKYFDKAEHALSSSEVKGNSISVVSYNVNGAKKAHFSYDQKGNLDGVDTIFYASGKINEINNYKNDEFNGPSVSYYLNGNKKTAINMTNGKNDGYYTSYYVNGHLEVEGWVKDGQNQGEWKYYDELGRLTTKAYFLDGDFDGYREDFLPNGEKITEQKYHRGWLEKMTQYDKGGKVLLVDTFPKCTGKYTLIYPGGEKMVEADYVNGDYNGPYKTYYFDGSPETVTYYKKGAKDSIYLSYYYGGIKSIEGSYKLGNKSGVWKYYQENGKPSSAIEYANDMMNGERVSYFDNGNKDRISVYKDDVLDGAVKEYDIDGTLAYQMLFENGDPRSYSYLGNDGKQVADIPIPGINGVMKSYYQNGKVSRECVYSDGVKNGPNVYYYASGQVRSVDTVAYGISQGISRVYYPNGRLRSEYHYQADNADGICREYNDKGILKKEIAYENGLNNGPAKYYDDNGKLVKTLSYYYGTLISVKNEK
ncbi:MAG: tetratricopeptide repeat protein [Mucilaginibacter sp.]